MSYSASIIHTIVSHTKDVTSVSFSHNVLASCSGDKTCRLWSLSDFSECSSSPLLGHKYSIRCCQFSVEDNILATCSTDGNLILWDCKSGNKLCIFEHKSKGSIRICRFSKDSKLIVTGSDDETICLWDIKARKLIRTFEGNEASIVACVFSPDCNYILSGSNNGDLRVWDAVYGHGKYLLMELDGHDLGVTGAEFSPTFGSAGPSEVSSSTNEHFLLATSGNDNLVKTWDLLTQPGTSIVKLQLRDKLLGHAAPVMAICFSPNGELLASGSGDKSIHLWDPVRALLLHTIAGHTRYITCCAFSTDGNILATGSNDRTVKLWKVYLNEDSSQHTDEITYDEDILLDDGVQTSRDNGAKLAQACANEESYLGWSVDDVASWLSEIGMSQYVKCFKDNAIDGSELNNLTDDVLKTALCVAALGHRNKILRAIGKIGEHPSIQHQHSMDDAAEDEYLCPITRELMNDPVIASDGYTYERCAIASWMKSGKTRSPMTNATLPNTSLTPNRSLKMLIQRYLRRS